MREKGEEMNPILQEMNELQHYKKKGRPKYSANMIRLETFLCIIILKLLKNMGTCKKSWDFGRLEKFSKIFDTEIKTRHCSVML